MWLQLGADSSRSRHLGPGMPDAYATRLADATGQERHPDLTWTTAAYVSHVTDNLRTWAGRLAGGYLAGVFEVPGYDPDLLSQACHYNEISLAGALWSLRWAVDGWAIPWKRPGLTLVLHQATRGVQGAEDVGHETTPTTHTTTCGTSTASPPPSKHVLNGRMPSDRSECMGFS